MARRKLESFEDYNRALKNKYGLGEGEDYKPWVRVQDVKSKGVRSQIKGLKTHRIHHTLSSIETEFFYIAEFCDSIIDIREQFPLFPLDLSGKISKVLDIKHPLVPGTSTPSVMTTDFILTRQVEGKIFYEAISVKPINDFKDQRVLEKLEIERVWWNLLGIKFQCYCGNNSTEIQSRNISWVTDPIRTISTFYNDSQIQISLSLLTIGRHIILDVCKQLSLNLDIKHDETLTLFRILIGRKYIEVDMSYLLETSDVIEILNINKL